MALPAAERMRRLRARRKAAGLKPVVEWRHTGLEPVAPYSAQKLVRGCGSHCHLPVR